MDWVRQPTALTLFVDDLAATREFYLRAFEQPVLFEDPDSVVFKLGDLLVNLLSTSAADELVSPAAVGSPAGGARFAITLSVDDVDAVCAVLTERGVDLLNGPIDRPWGVRTASFRDPSGHVWEIAR